MTAYPWGSRTYVVGWSGRRWRAWYFDPRRRQWEFASEGLNVHTGVSTMYHGPEFPPPYHGDAGPDPADSR